MTDYGTHCYGYTLTDFNDNLIRETAHAAPVVAGGGRQFTDREALGALQRTHFSAERLCTLVSEASCRGFSPGLAAAVATSARARAPSPNYGGQTVDVDVHVSRNTSR